MTEKHSTDLKSIIREGVVNAGHDINNILVCRVQYLEMAPLVSLLVLLKIQVPKNYNTKNT